MVYNFNGKDRRQLKRIYFITIAIVLSLSFAYSAFADEPTAQETTYECHIISERGDVPVRKALSDKSYTTYITLDTDEELTFTASDAAWVYIKFYGTAPDSYYIKAQASDSSVTELSCGGKGFLHETIKLPDSAESFTLSCPEQAKICEVELYTEGKLPENVQIWEETLSSCDVLVMATHADDDTLFFGALISEQAALGRLVQTAFMCGHSGELHRLNELLDGQWTLGVKFYPIMGRFPDFYSTSLKTAQKQYDSNKVTDFIVESVRRTHPLVLVTHDVDGEYGHGAHRLVSKLTLDASSSYADASAFDASAEAYGAYAPSKIYVHLWDENEIVLDVKREMPELSGLSPFDVAAKAYKCHTSQQKYAFKVTVSGTNDCRRFGLYSSLVDCDPTSSDIMNGLTPIIPNISETFDPAIAEYEFAPSSSISHVHEETSNDGFDPLSIFVHDSNGRTTTVPMSSVAVCAVILILFVIYVIYHFAHGKRK